MKINIKCSDGKSGFEVISSGQYRPLIKYLDCGDLKKPVSLNDVATKTLYFYADGKFQKVVEKKKILNPELHPENQSCGNKI